MALHLAHTPIQIYLEANGHATWPLYPHDLSDIIHSFCVKVPASLSPEEAVCQCFYSVIWLLCYLDLGLGWFYKVFLCKTSSCSCQEWDVACTTEKIKPLQTCLGVKSFSEKQHAEVSKAYPTEPQALILPFQTMAHQDDCRLWCLWLLITYPHMLNLCNIRRNALKLQAET